MSRVGTAMRSAGSVAKESEDIRHAKEAHRTLVDRLDELNAEVEQEIHRVQNLFDADLMEFGQEEIKPRKTDVTIHRVALVWLPFTSDTSGRSRRAF